MVFAARRLDQQRQAAGMDFLHYDRVGAEYLRNKEMALRGMCLTNRRLREKGVSLYRLAEAVRCLEQTFGGKMALFPIDSVSSVIRRVLYGLRLVGRDQGLRQEGMRVLKTLLNEAVTEPIEGFEIETQVTAGSSLDVIFGDKVRDGLDPSGWGELVRGAILQQVKQYLTDVTINETNILSQLDIEACIALGRSLGPSLSTIATQPIPLALFWQKLVLKRFKKAADLSYDAFSSAGLTSPLLLFSQQLIACYMRYLNAAAGYDGHTHFENKLLKRLKTMNTGEQDPDAFLAFLRSQYASLSPRLPFN